MKPPDAPANSERDPNRPSSRLTVGSASQPLAVCGLDLHFRYRQGSSRGFNVLGSVELQPEESPAMIARLIFELVVLTSSLSFVIYELNTTVAEMV